MKEWINDHINEHIALLKELAAIPAPSHREDARVRFILDLMRGLQVGAYADCAKNVIVPFGCENGGDFSVYSAHTDVVFPDETPLPVREEAGKLYAPGVGDDTANVAALISIVRFIKEKGLEKEIRSPFMIVFNSCEEGLGNLKGVRQIMKDHGARVRELVSFDCPLEEGVIVGAVGSERWRIRAVTRGGHSYFDFGSPNAIHRMAGLISGLYAQPIPSDGRGKTTFNAGVITGGTSVNTIAQSAELLYEYRSEDRESLAAMRFSLSRLVAEASRDGAEFTAELIGERPCSGGVDTEKLAALAERCESAVFAVTGKRMKRSSASTDANIPLSMGVPAVTFGLYSGAGEHTRGEWLELSSLAPGLEIGLRLILGGHFRADLLP